MSDIEKLKEKLAKDPRSRMFMQLADAQMKAGAVDEAIAVLKGGLEHHTNYPSAHVALGKAYISKDMSAEAMEQFQKAVNISPDNLFAHRKLADLYREAGDGRRALADYKEVQRLNPMDEEVKGIVNELEAAVGALDEGGDGGEKDSGMKVETTRYGESISEDKETDEGPHEELRSIKELDEEDVKGAAVSTGQGEDEEGEDYGVVDLDDEAAGGIEELSAVAADVGGVMDEEQPQPSAGTEGSQDDEADEPEGVIELDEEEVGDIAELAGDFGGDAPEVEPASESADDTVREMVVPGETLELSGAAEVQETAGAAIEDEPVAEVEPVAPEVEPVAEVEPVGDEVLGVTELPEELQPSAEVVEAADESGAEAEEVTDDIFDTVAETGTMAQEPEDAAMEEETEAEPVVPEAEPVVPEAEPVVPEAEPVVPEAEPVVPEAEPVVPEAEPVAQEAEPVVPEAEPVVPEEEPVAPVALSQVDKYIDEGNYAEALKALRRLLEGDSEDAVLKQRYEELLGLIRMLGKEGEIRVESLASLLNAIKRRRDEFFGNT